jgi:P27 family predicted phage terminase small subunit
VVESVLPYPRHEKLPTECHDPHGRSIETLVSAERPDWLSDDARAVWDALDTAVIERADADALAVYCCAVADYARARTQLDQSGPLIRGAKGSLIKNPLVMIVRDAAATISRLSQQLGIGQAPEGRSDAGLTTPRYRNRAATERTITALRQGGRLEDVDAATLALARHLAQALDELDAARFPTQTAGLARVQLSALASLRGERDADAQPTSDALVAWLSSPVGDFPQP